MFDATPENCLTKLTYTSIAARSGEALTNRTRTRFTAEGRLLSESTSERSAPAGPLTAMDVSVAGARSATTVSSVAPGVFVDCTVIVRDPVVTFS